MSSSPAIATRSTHAPSGAPPPTDPARPWVTLAVVSMGLFLAVVSTTVVSIALPTMGRDLHASASELEWVVDAYVVVYAALLVCGGALGDRWGRKGLFLAGVGLFGAGAALAGLAPSIGVLLGARVLQGIGPALLVPGSLTIIRAVFPEPRRRAMAIGLWSTSSGIALALGPPLGGLLVAGLGWRAVFWFNAPLAAALVAVSGHYMPRLPRIPSPGRFDWPGATLISAGVGLLAVGVIDGQARGWGAPLVLAAFAAGAGAVAGFIGAERRRADPLIDLSLFGSYRFSMANGVAFVLFFAFVGAIVYFSAYFQQVQGHGPIEAGLDIVAIGVAYAAAAAGAGRMIGRVGERWPLLVGLVVSGLATLGLLRLQPSTGIGAIWWDFALLGVGIGLCGTPTSTIAMSAVAADRAGMASAVINAMRQIGQVFGVGVLGALVFAQLPGATGTSHRLTPAQQALFVTGLHHAVWVCGLALLAAAAATLGLFPLRRWSHHSPIHPHPQNKRKHHGH